MWKRLSCQAHIDTKQLVTLIEQTTAYQRNVASSRLQRWLRKLRMMRCIRELVPVKRRSADGDPPESGAIGDDRPQVELAISTIGRNGRLKGNHGKQETGEPTTVQERMALLQAENDWKQVELDRQKAEIDRQQVEMDRQQVEIDRYASERPCMFKICAQPAPLHSYSYRLKGELRVAGLGRHCSVPDVLPPHLCVSVDHGKISILAHTFHACLVFLHGLHACTGLSELMWS